MTSPYLQTKCRTFREAVREITADESYIVLSPSMHPSHTGKIAEECPFPYRRADVVRDIAEGQYANAVQVIGLAEGISWDATEDIALGVLEALIENGEALSGYVPEIVTENVEDAEQRIEEARLDMGIEDRYRKSVESLAGRM